jgi:Fe-S cluster assembly iron-binding protein IscA
VVLEISASAATVVRDLAATIASERALVRFASHPTATDHGCHVDFVEVPQPDDRVWQSQGMRLCADPALSRQLAGKLLDVAQGWDGRTLVIRSS